MAALAAGLVLPTAAQAATVLAAGAPTPPAPQKSDIVAGYEQLGCHTKGYPVYAEIQGTVVVPAATQINGAAGISFDILTIGGFSSGVSAGVAVDNGEDHATYVPFGQWGSHGAQVTPFSAKPGDKLGVTIENKGSSGWLVEIVDEASGQKWSRVKHDAGDLPCQAGAVEESDYPAYDYLTQTTPVAFDFTKVWWAEHGRAGMGKLLGAAPAGATLHQYNLVSSHNITIAATSAPTDKDSNFTVTDAIPTIFTPNLAGYEVTQSRSQGHPYTRVQATWKLPKVTQTNPDSYAFAYFFAGIGNANGSGLMAGVEETMAYGSVSYQAFAAFGTQVETFQSLTVHPGDTIKVLIFRLGGNQWNAEVYDQTTGNAAAAGGAINVSQYDAEVAELRPANPIGPGYLPLTATTPVTFDHATFANAAGKAYPFETVLPGGSLQRLYMQNDSATTTIAATSQPDSDKDGFTVQNGDTAPAAPNPDGGT